MRWLMQELGDVIGQAIFIRTDTPDYAEELIPFHSLEELVLICSKPHPNLTLEKIVIYSVLDGSPSALTLGFISSARSPRPADLHFIDH
jgi:hypothetical protein